MSVNAETDFKARLITSVKKEVKQVMEESVTRKFVHEESGSVTALCGAVEACLSQGLRRRALGLFKTSSTTALLHKIAKHSSEAAIVSKKVQEIENIDPNRRSSSSSDSLTKPTLKKNMSLQSNPLPKYLWIRLALFEKQLAKIIDYLVSNANRYYDKDALVADPDYGSILSSLLVGPCALDYSKTKTPDHFWTDPPADELVQRHRISSAHTTPPSVRRPILNFRRSLNTSSEDSITNRSTTQLFAKDYVESLHQNSRATLLFGKNNVLVLPAKADVTEPMPGYLSLHQAANGLTIKWTPNQLMNGFTDESQDKSIYWDYALQVRLDDIVYVHCHQESESGGTIILVGQDGVQRPPIHFPKGGHMLAFLSCIETGLLPRGRLDPPLWSQRPGATSSNNKRRRPLTTLDEAEETTKDYVFRIIDNSNHKDIGLKRNQLMDTHTKLPGKFRVQLASSSTSSESSTKSFSLDQNAPDSPPSICIRAVCDSMKRQIISRAFYGWLAYCRHLSTVRTHLSGLVNSNMVSGEGASEGLTFEKWLELCVDGVVKDSNEIYRLTYYGGIAQDLRKDVWPYLLGHYKFGSTTEERNQLCEETKQAYENTMSEWLAVEAIVRQRDKETQANAIAKLSSESISGDQVPNQMQRDLSNEVFEDISDYDYESTEEEEPTTKRHKKTKQNTIKYESDEEEPGTIPVANGKMETVEKYVNDTVQNGHMETETNVSTEKVGQQDVVTNEIHTGNEACGNAQINEQNGSNTETSQELSRTCTSPQVVDDVQRKLESNGAEQTDKPGERNACANPGISKVNSQEEPDICTESASKNSSELAGTNNQNVQIVETLCESLAEIADDAEILKQDAEVEQISKSLSETEMSEAQQNKETTNGAMESSAHKRGDKKIEGHWSMDTENSSRDTECSSVCTEISVKELRSCDNVNQRTNSVDNLEYVADVCSEPCAPPEEVGQAVTTPKENKTEFVCSEIKDFIHNVIVTNASIDLPCHLPESMATNNLDVVNEENNSLDILDCMESHGLASPARSACVSPASSNGGVYSTELLETFGLNLHRIEKDVQRCDRNYWYFTPENLDKLRNVMCTYVWEHLDIGYMQGMCDLVAPLLVVFNDESLTYACFCHLMQRMVENFPNGNAMDSHFANMRSLIQILDSEMYELMHSHGDYTHFYFCYRWFLLDFKRELVYHDVYATWEVIWAAQHVASSHFVLFLALALLESYRDIILSNSMDFTDIIKFFNEMAERHNATAVLGLARDLVLQLQLLIENK